MEYVSVHAALVSPQSFVHIDEDSLGGGWDSLEPNDLDWCGRAESHVDFEPSELLPLAQETFLGHGVNGPVYSARCKDGLLVAWKKVYCRRGITSAERKEIDVLKKLSNKHIIKLVGTYTQGPYLGLLLWPVAVIDLASFHAQLDWLAHQPRLKNDGVEDEKYTQKLRDFRHVIAQLRLPIYEDLHRTLLSLEAMLRKCIGCLTSAVAYLHDSSVRHKDLKPSNILLYPDGLRLTDFGTATDFTDSTRSATDNGERGTPKYFSPEMAAFENCGRASDIFSLGCIYLEMLAVANRYPLEKLKQSRPTGDRSFWSNLPQVHSWFDTADFVGLDNLLLNEIKLMLQLEPQSRPTINHVQRQLKLIESLSTEPSKSVYHGQCCSFSPPVGFEERETLTNDGFPAHVEIDLAMKDTSDEQKDPTWLISVHSPIRGQCIDWISCICDHRIGEPRQTLTKEPFEFSFALQFCQNSAVVGTVAFIIVLKSGTPVPHSSSYGRLYRQNLTRIYGWLELTSTRRLVNRELHEHTFKPTTHDGSPLLFSEIEACDLLELSRSSERSGLELSLMDYQSFPCNFCGESFSLERDLENHHLFSKCMGGIEQAWDPLNFKGQARVHRNKVKPKDLRGMGH